MFPLYVFNLTDILLNFLDFCYNNLVGYTEVIIYLISLLVFFPYISIFEKKPDYI